MITQEQINQLVDMYGLEWVDYIEYLEQENTQCDS